MIEIKGRFFDGETAKAHAVTLRWRAEAVEILDINRNGIVIWPLDNIRLKKEVVKSESTRFFCTEDINAELVIDNAEMSDQLKDRCVNLNKKLPEEQGAWKPFAFWGTAAIVSVVLIFWLIIPSMSQQIANILPM